MEQVDLNFHFYKAVIFKRMGANDDRLQVRIMPYMKDIKETDNLPCYPMLFKGQFVNGWAEDDDRPEDVQPDCVLVMSTDDFTYGYIVGNINLFNSIDKVDSVENSSYGFSYINQFLSGRGLETQEYDSLVVQNWTYCGKGDATGGLLELYNYKTGEKFILNASGTCILMYQDKLVLRCGSPKSKNTEQAQMDNPPFSQITMTPDSIVIKSNNIELDWKDNLCLGKGGQSVLTTASVMDAAVVGVNFHPNTHITA